MLDASRIRRVCAAVAWLTLFAVCSRQRRGDRGKNINRSPKLHSKTRKSLVSPWILIIAYFLFNFYYFFLLFCFYLSMNLNYLISFWIHELAFRWTSLNFTYALCMHFKRGVHFSLLSTQNTKKKMYRILLRIRNETRRDAGRGKKFEIIEGEGWGELWRRKMARTKRNFCLWTRRRDTDAMTTRRRREQRRQRKTRAALRRSR